MDFIERLLAMSPDGGYGTTEAVILMGITLIVVFVARRRHSAKTEE